MIPFSFFFLFLLSYSFFRFGVKSKILNSIEIHSNINFHSEFIVKDMRIIGQNNRENLLAAVTACKALDASDEAIQTCVEKFPGIPHRLEFLMEKNGVCFYNDSKAESMPNLCESLKSFKNNVILIAGGKDNEEIEFEPFNDDVINNTRVVVLVGECKERMNRALQEHPQTFIVGSFEESVLLAYQKSRTGDTILMYVFFKK